MAFFTFHYVFTMNLWVLKNKLSYWADLTYLFMHGKALYRIVSMSATAAVSVGL